MLARFGKVLVATLLVALVACRAPIPGLGSLPGNPKPGGSAAQGSDLATGPSDDRAAGEAGNPLPDSPTAPWIGSMQPDNGGPGVEVRLTGKNLAVPGVQVFFGTVGASEIKPQPDGSLAVVVPEGARTGNLAVVRGHERAIRWFRVLSRLDVTVLRPLPIPVGVEVPVLVTGEDTEGAYVSKPYYTLSVDPADAADVVTPTTLVARREVPFKVQAFSGRIQAIQLAEGCSQGFTLTTFAGDGRPIHFVAGNPVLTQGSTESNNFAEVGPADTAHITEPWGVVTFKHPRLGDGVLIADSVGNRVRFVPLDGASITTVVGGGSTPAATDSKPARSIELLSPAGLAVGKDYDGKEVVVIVERARHQILRWEPVSDMVEIIAGSGIPTVSSNASASPAELGDRNDAKKICGEPTKATFTDPAGVALVSMGNKRSVVFVADTENHRIRKIVRIPPNEALNQARSRNCTIAPGDVITGEITTILGSGKPGSDISSSDPASTSINAPMAVAAHPDAQAQNFKYVFVADTNNNRILEVSGALEDAQATFSVRVAVPPPGHRLAPLNHPYGLFLHPGTKDLLITDTLRNRVLRFRRAENHLQDMATCSLSASPSNGLVWPRGITSRDPSPTGQNFPAFVSDYFSNQIRLLDTGNNQ